MRTRKTARNRLAGIDTTLWWDFQPGDRVVTKEGLPGVVSSVEDGPVAGYEQYMVELDNGMGGGAYGPSELRSASLDATASLSAEANRRSLDIGTDLVMHEWERLARDFPQLNTWRFQVGKTKGARSAGEANFLYKTVTIAPWAVEQLSDDELLDTVRHEVAHALAGASAGHGNEWKNWCYRTGANPNATFRSDADPGYKWIAVCPTHGPTGGGWFRKPTTQYICRECQQDIEVLPKTARKVASKIQIECSLEGDVATMRSVASDDYPELAEILVERPAPSYIETTASKIASRLPSLRAGLDYDSTIMPHEGAVGVHEAGFWDRILEPVADWMHSNQDPRTRFDPARGNFASYDACRFRRDSECYYPKGLDVAATERAGYDVWIPENRGRCWRDSWDDQKACPMYQPGPNANDPYTNYTDATWSWDQGGQRYDSYGQPIHINPYNASRRVAQEQVEVANSVEEMADPEGARAVKDMAEMVDAYRKNKYDSDSNPYTAKAVKAAWEQVEQKARDIRSGGGVNVIAVTDDSVTATVSSTSGSSYTTTLWFNPGTKQVAFWECDCKWAQYSWGRSGKWKKYEGRMCSHATALRYEFQSRSMFGQEVLEDPQDQGDPFKIASDLSAEAMSAPSFKVKWRNAIHTVIDILHGGTTVLLAGGQEVPASEVTNPDYHPTRGITSRRVTSRWQEIGWESEEANEVIEQYPHLASTHHLAQNDDIEDGVMVAIKPPDDVLAAIHMPDGESFEQLHITLAYFGKDAEVDKEAFVDTVRAWAATTAPYEGRIQGYGFFDTEERVLYASPGIPGLSKSRHALVDALGEVGIHAYENHDYIPHLTLQYGAEGVPSELPEGADEPFTIGTVWAVHGPDWIPVSLGGLTTEAELKDEPEAALPEVTGEAEEESGYEIADVDTEVEPEVQTLDNTASRQWIMEGGSGDDDIAKAASAFLEKTSLKTFTAEEQQAFISEGEDEGVRARNLDKLEISDTHYALLEDDEAEEDFENLWVSL